MSDSQFLSKKSFTAKADNNLLVLLFLLAGFVFSSVYLLKSSAFFLTGLLLFALWDRWRPTMSLVTAPKAVWWFVGSLLVFWSVHLLSLLVHGNFERFFTFRMEFLHFLLALPILVTLFSQHRLSSVSWYRILIIVACTTGIYDLMLIVQQTVRGNGLLTTPITRGNMGMLIGLLAYVSFFGVRERVWRVLAILGFVCGVGLSLLSGSRGGWLALLLVFFTSYWLVISHSQYRGYFWSFIAVTLLIIMMLWPFLPIQQRLELAFLDIFQYVSGNTHTSLGARFEAWKASIYAFQERPIFGWGLASFNSFIQHYNELGVTNGLSIGHAHNDLFLYAGELGIVGLLALWAIILTPLWWLLKAIKYCDISFEQRVIILMGLTVIESMVEFSLSDQTFSMRYPFQFYVISILVVLSLLYRKKYT